MAKRRPDISHYRSRQFLLSRNELAFFLALRCALGQRWHLFAKVRLADVIACPDSKWEKTPGRRIAQKHVDFLVCHPDTTRIIAAIELDDRTHERPLRRQRDVFLNDVFRRAGIPLLRYRARSSYEAEALKRFWQSSFRFNVSWDGHQYRRTKKPC